MGTQWHDDVFFGLHFDIHANEDDRDLGKYADRAELVEQFRKIGPDFVQCDCKGHPGFASYPSKAGIPAPGIVKDALREWREATREMGIPLVMHYSGVWDAAALAEHPDWALVQADGKPSETLTCPLSGYTEEYMIPQLQEIIREYDVDGFWVDGENWASAPCYCGRCTAAFREKTGYAEIPHSAEDPHWDEWLRFSRENFERHVTLYTDAIHACKPECTSCSNWMYTVREPDEITVPIDYISGDFSWIWSAGRALLETKFLDTRGKKWDLMAWGFTSHGTMDEWVFKSVDARCQEGGVVMANGGAVTIYDTPNRWGTLVHWHMDDLAEVARFCRARQPFCQGSEVVPQAAILHNAAHFYAHNSPLFNFGEAVQPVEGALHAVNQNGIAANILTAEDLLRHLEEYPLCVIPEQTRISKELHGRLADYVKNGGALLLSGESCKEFEAELGVRFPEEMPRGYYGIDRDISVEVGRRTQPVAGKWFGAKNVSAEIAKPLLASRDSGPDRKETGFAAATVKRCGKGVIAGLYGPAFEGFFLSHYPMLRRFFRELLDDMAIPGLVRAEASPSVSISVRRKENQLQVHFVNLSCDPATAPGSSSVEFVPDAGPVTVSVPLEAAPKSVCIQPEGRSAEWSYADGALTVRLPRIGIHDILVIER